MAKQSGYNPVKNTEQEIANLGLDRDFNVPFREVMAYETTTDTLERINMTDGKLDVNASVTIGDVTLTGADGAIVDGVNTALRATVTAAKAVKVDGSAVTQPVSGPLTNTELRATPVSVTESNPLTGFATSAKQLPDNHQVTVSNIASTPVITGFATSTIQTDGTQVTKIKETIPTDSTKNNSSTALSYDVNGDLQYIDETIGATTYRTTLTYTARVLVGISEAVAL